MNREKIVKELNGWAKKELGSEFRVETDCGDLTLFRENAYIAWFTEFNKFLLRFSSSDNGDINVELIKKNIIEKFYEKGFEVLSNHEPKYTVKITHSEEFYLNVDTTDNQEIIFDELVDSSMWKNKFTPKEIEELKKRDDVAVDWNKAIIKEVKENEND